VLDMLKSPTKTGVSLWRSRTAEVGWVLLPLRVFLGVTMIYAGLLKFFDPAYLDPNSPNGVQQQMLAASSSSPIGFLVSFTADHAALFGLTIAFGELAVGLGVLLGLWTRVAAAGGFLLSMSFFLTVSWGTSPYFFGPDIVFMFAFTPLIIGGDGGLFSLQAAIRTATRQSMHLATPAPKSESAAVAADVDRRVLLRTGVAAAAIGAGALAVGALGRMLAGNSSGSVAQAATTSTGGTAAQASSLPAPLANGASAAPAAAAAKPKGGVKIAKASDVAVGGVLAFTHPTTNDPAYVLQPKAGTYLAYSAVCTHQGCTVGYDQSGNQFACPCHGARFDASTGDVVRGPAQAPLDKFNVVESNGSLYVI
jgi:thiosulfate dehydrogenase [quinone] large subunit